MSVEERLAAVEERLRAAEDRLALLQLVATYGPAVDSGSAGQAAGLWAEDGVYDTFPVVLEGRDAIRDMVTGELHQGLIAAGAAHLLTLPHVELDGDRAVLTNHSQLVLRDGDGFRVWRTGVNRWECARTADGWRVVSRVNRLLDGSPGGRAVAGAAFG
ncbi:nuclear transport factor 2 family protein [Actinosynnema sp. NPDC020468]|uniref:nuclear transport factor 2 family protein n=1 Tax=Actinosynnema sp. NPDC020468 TaxID=3154488 RepID=UPI0033EF8B80